MLTARMRILAALVEEEVPAGVDLWPRIQPRLPPQRHRWLRTTRQGWAAAGLALFVALTTAAYAMVPILQRAFQQERGLQRIELQRLGQEIDLRQTVGGFTIALQRVYADANRIVIGYTVSGPAGLEFNNFLLTGFTLTDQEGREYPIHSGVGAGMEGDTGGYVFSFDAGVLPQTPDRLRLRLVTDVMGFPRTPSPQEERPRAGPFTFDFSVPVIPGRVMASPQTAKVDGTRITLQRVVVTPSETRIVLQLSPAPEAGGSVEREWAPIVDLQVSDAAPQVQRMAPDVGRFGGFGQWQGGVYDYRIPYPLYDCRGEWTLTVHELVGFARGEGQVRLAGPWLFRFTVP